jgi:hypothetical protein
MTMLNPTYEPSREENSGPRKKPVRRYGMVNGSYRPKAAVQRTVKE